MKRLLFALMGVLVFSVINYGIYEKEQVLKNGTQVFLKTAPVDPRSWMQGDYMRLRYEVESEAAKQAIPQTSAGDVVVHCAAEEACTFVDFYHEQPLKDNERLFHARFTESRVMIKPDTFMFQEGFAGEYRGAAYAVFKFLGHETYVLVNLADKDKKIIHPENSL